MLIYKGGKFIKNIFKNLLIVFVALQPLQSYTIINYPNPHDNNGFEYLHAELCGSKYTGSISHSQKLSDLLDRINTALISDMAVDCVCCESVDITSLDLIDFSINKLLISKYLTSIQRNFYVSSIEKSLSHTIKVRAPPNV
mgnify:CR=1 FL=1